MKRVGPTGNVVALVICQEDADLLKSMNLCHHAIVGSATNPTEVLEKSLAVNGGKEYDVSILIVNVPACEMAAILPVRDNGTVYFFSMATDFAKAALGAEGCGKDVTMIVGNGYTKDHAEQGQFTCPEEVKSWGPCTMEHCVGRCVRMPSSRSTSRRSTCN